MNQENTLEIYKQRYETYRHLDRLRWQMVQISVAVFTATALIIRVSNGNIEWWFTSALGAALIAISFSMSKISDGLRANQLVLKAAADTIGDHNIPDVSQKRRSVFNWISYSIGALGLIFLLTSILEFVGVTQ